MCCFKKLGNKKQNKTKKQSKLNRGISIVLKPTGGYAQVRYLQDSDFDSYPAYYQGGYNYTVDETTKAALIAGGGKLLQVVYATTSTNVNVASTTYADTGVTATITPTSATSTILVFVNQQNHSAGSGISQVGCGLRLLRGSTTIYTPDNALKYGQSFAAVSGTISGLANMASFAYQDSPATTSATTYKVQGATNNTAGGGQTLFQESSSASNIVLMEIGA